jgi:protein gp37
MGQNSSIEWTDHTFNPWWGCAKVSPGCEHCYAEAWAKRVGETVWGTQSSRRHFGEKHWKEPTKWNHDCVMKNLRKRVFCASMADVFEDRNDLNPSRQKLWELILETPHLDWLLLTKRPQNIRRLSPWQEEWPTNIWLGTTVEDQERANERLPHLLACSSNKRFLSCEPLLGAVDLSPWLEARSRKLHPIDWVIAGGESGPGARPMLPTWAYSLRDQCKNGGVPFHFKQWGHWTPLDSESAASKRSVRRFWDEITGKEIVMEPIGKKKAGRELDGRTWDELPQAYGGRILPV